MSPEWVRVGVGGCATLANTDRVDYRIDIGDGDPVVAAESEAAVCFSEPGVHRLHTTGEPYDGGFVIVDEED